MAVTWGGVSSGEFGDPRVGNETSRDGSLRVPLEQYSREDGESVIVGKPSVRLPTLIRD